MEESADQIASLLSRAQRGDVSAAEAILPLVYEDLRRMAHWHMSREPAGGAGHTLQPTALVHEAYVRMLAGKEIAWADKRHFFAAAALAMRRILVERARRVAGPKAGGGRKRETIETDALAAPESGPEANWELLDEAMTALGAEDPELAEVVHLRYFAGLSVDAVGLALDASPRTIDRRWQVARAWILDWAARRGTNSRLFE